MPNSSRTELAPKIQVVSIETALNFYPRNLLAEVFRFRGRHIRAKNWRDGISYILPLLGPEITESDLQDNPGTVYFVKSDCDHKIVGVVRISPSIDENKTPISMLGTTMSRIPNLVHENLLPKSHDVFESSRLVLDTNRLDTQEKRKSVVNELLAATVFFAAKNGIRFFFGCMINKFWESTLVRMQFELEKLGEDATIKDEGHDPYIVSARRYVVDENRISNVTGLDSSILDFGNHPTI